MNGTNSTKPSLHRRIRRHTIIYTFIIFSILLWTVYIILYPRLSYQNYKDWWSHYDPDEKHNCIDLDSLAYWQFSYIIYKIRQAIVPGTEHIENDAWIMFITSMIYSDAKGIVPGGVVTPKTLCETLVPPTPPGSSHKWPSDKTGWITTIKQWGNITFDPSDTGSYKYDGKAWANEPDNFIFHDWAIPADSVLLVGFLTGWSSDSTGTPLYPSAMDPLLGLVGGVQSGGWWGFLQGGGYFSDMGIDAIRRIVWAEDKNATFRFQTRGGSGQVGQSTESKAMKWASFGMQVIGTGAMIAMLAAA